jgi:hypothetical protein
MIIDMPNATSEEIQAVFRSIRECAAQGEVDAWPEHLAVLVGDAATEISERAREAIAQRKIPSQTQPDTTSEASVNA